MRAVPSLAHWGFWVDGNSLPDLTVFRPLDIERYAKRLSLESRGAERGATNQPPADALALSRAPQQNKDGWAARFRAMKIAQKAKK